MPILIVVFPNQKTLTKSLPSLSNLSHIVTNVSNFMFTSIQQRCGNMMSWKRVQGATGKLQAFGFCEYADPEASLRAIRLLHDLELGDKKLVVSIQCDQSDIMIISFKI